MLMLILLSCTAFVVETIPSMCCGRYDQVFRPTLPLQVVASSTAAAPYLGSSETHEVETWFQCYECHAFSTMGLAAFYPVIVSTCLKHKFVLQIWQVIEVVCVSAFTVEYAGRLLLCPTWHGNKAGTMLHSSHTWGIVAETFSRVRFIFQPLNIIDLAAILPFYLQEVSAPNQTCVCVCVCACVRACVCACVCVRARALS
jgi:hypothetical protein